MTGAQLFILIGAIYDVSGKKSMAAFCALLAMAALIIEIIGGMV